MTSEVSLSWSQPHLAISFQMHHLISITTMDRAELVFIPAPGMGHLFSALQIAKLLVHRDDRLSITVLIIKLPMDSKINSHTESLASSSSSISTRIRSIHLPDVDISPDQLSSGKFFDPIMEAHKPNVKQIVSDLAGSTPIAGCVLDMFCLTFMEVADHVGVPSYVFFTSGAAILDFMFQIQVLHDEQKLDLTDLKDTDNHISLPAFSNPVPAKVFPSVFLHKDWLPASLDIGRRCRKAKGVMVNTFAELEPRAVHSLHLSASANKTPPIYSVGPVLNLNPSDENKSSSSSIIEWLDEQSPKSVVFLCFGSAGSFDEKQVVEIAHALEHSGHRFLWALRKPPSKGMLESPSEYTDFQEVLPEGFLERTAQVGKVIGWAPQVEVLAHPSVGGFVSHCGWNSTLESIWFGVPMAAWPLYAEQQLNAFGLVTELGLAVEIQMDYRKDFFVGGNTEGGMVVGAEIIERGIREVMEVDSVRRRKVEEMGEKSRKAVGDGGSSFSSLARFIQDVMDTTA